MTYRDKRGYEREHSDAVHRHRAYHHIYLKDRKKYTLPFSAYEVHHIDGDKTNNRMENLAVLTPEEHDKAHEEMERENIENKKIFTKITAKKIFIKKITQIGLFILVLLILVWRSSVAYEKRGGIFMIIILVILFWVFVVFFFMRLGKIIRSLRIMIKKEENITQEDFRKVLY